MLATAAGELPGWFVVATEMMLPMPAASRPITLPIQPLLRSSQRTLAATSCLPS
ncbi:hypothetical protein MCHI_003292 [Candidatus Magnetoovum chiemensis]|nr:hypothetical protein MCHI_003292 [Candidatus Magnetoovum chiemensis]